MKRPHIDVAIHAQIDRSISVLRTVTRSGGKDVWSHLFSHGHKFPTVRHCVRQGYLTEPHSYHYEITDSGRRFLDDIDLAALREQR